MKAIDSLLLCVDMGTVQVRNRKKNKEDEAAPHPLSILFIFIRGLQIRRVTAFPAGICGEPAFSDAIFLFLQFVDTPQAGEPQYCQKRRQEGIGDKQGDGAAQDSGHKEQRPDLGAEMIFAFYHDRVEYTYEKKGCQPDQDPPYVHRYITSCLEQLFSGGFSGHVIYGQLEYMDVVES